MIKSYTLHYKSPIGMTKITAKDSGILVVDFIEKRSDVKNQNTPIIKKCIKQLDEYFKGKRKKFSLKMDFLGTDFQKKVWRELAKIPFSKTVSYKYIAERIGNSKACRAVGNAINKNKIAIIIPCHRVIGSNGKLVGYAGGLWRKKWLLEHEKYINSIIKK